MTARLSAVALLLASAACGGNDPTPAASSAPPTTAPATTPAPTTTTSATAPPADATAGDMDGDRKPDTVTIVESGKDRTASTWRWGLRVALTGGGTKTLWNDYGVESQEGQSVTGFADLDEDGRLEVVVQAGSTATSAGQVIATLVDGELVWLTLRGERFTVEESEVPEERGFGCADVVPGSPGRELVVITIDETATEHQGAREAYALRRGELTRVGRDTATWAAAETPPTGYVLDRCGLGVD
ncbi:MAG TPA: VCBS repeat-containing protein [Frankiaceae bacterium]|nr:VCBS repeat-containing protein [Frankiaceae bacterium]